MHTIRGLAAEDIDAVVALSLRAWEPVFASLERALGPGLFRRMHPDWRADQAKAVGEVCVSAETPVWVAETGTAVAGFVALMFDRAGGLGEIHMVAVDPPYQRRGIGASLIGFGTERLEEAGIPVAMVETGGDPGHAPARALYERTGFTPLPVVRYFKAL